MFKNRKVLSLRPDQQEAIAQEQAGRAMAENESVDEAEQAIDKAKGFQRDPARHIKRENSERSRNNRERTPAAGHEIPLASLIKRKTLAEFTTTNGYKFSALIVGFDNYTITVIIEGAKKRTTFFKAALESFTTAADQF